MAEMFLTRDYEFDRLKTLEGYASRGGYRGAAKALKEMTPAQVLEAVKNSGLRGRGGAGFPAGLKWSFVPARTDKPKYLCINADEGEPGTFKDRIIMSRSPHSLIEGAVITSYAVGIHSAYIYVRGEYEAVAKTLEGAIGEATAAGYLGRAILGTEFSLDLTVHRGAGSYICGEETALLNSLEGKRGLPRLKPPFPAVVGLFDSPTVINNVETIANIPTIILLGPEQFRQVGRPKDSGTRVYGVSGPVKRPGIYELPVGVLLRELIFEHAGGLKDGRVLKAVIPGGMSAPVLTASEIDIPMDFDSLAQAGSMLGSAGVIVIDETTPILAVLKKVTKFYAHESCGQCTPCRLGTAWMDKIVTRMRKGEGRRADLETLLRLAAGIRGRTMCPMGDAAAMPVQSLVQKFRPELEAGLKG
jgi:NADH-quinone oxidoreductase subunit F